MGTKHSRRLRWDPTFGQNPELQLDVLPAAAVPRCSREGLKAKEDRPQLLVTLDHLRAGGTPLGLSTRPARCPMKHPFEAVEHRRFGRR